VTPDLVIPERGRGEIGRARQERERGERGREREREGEREGICVCPLQKILPPSHINTTLKTTLQCRVLYRVD